MTVEPGEAPSHVPSERIVDIDVYDPAPGAADPLEAWKAFRDRSAPMTWTGRNGGHWIATRGEVIRSVFTDHDHFSSAVLMVPRERGLTNLLPTAADPPRHRAYRMLINKALSPVAIRTLEPAIRQRTRDLIAGFVDRGHADFIADFAAQLPTGVFLRLAELPVEDHAMLDRWMGQIMRPDGEATQEELMARFAEYLRPILAQRRAAPGEDILSGIASGMIEGRPIGDDEAISMATAVVLGGLDTVIALMSFSMNSLARDARLQRRLVEQPERIPDAVEEFCRRFPVGIATRLVVRDTERDGVILKAGDLIVLPSILHSLDTTEYADPETIDIDRAAGGGYSTFGHGVHRCPGAFLGKAELRVLLEEWLASIPEFHVADGAEVRVTTGISSGIFALPLAWTVDPAARRAAGQA